MKKPSRRLTITNALVERELRTGLRGSRSFALLGLYVLLLGGVLVAAFPAGKTIDFMTDGGSTGSGLFWSLVWGQAALVLMLLPALSTGALAEERDSGALEGMLLTPLSPLQIITGKASGVLSLMGLMLLATVPLTSLCFILGGVSPGEFLLAYSCLFGLAAWVTAFGLYCAALYSSSTKALFTCYFWIPIVLGIFGLGSMIGWAVVGRLITHYSDNAPLMIGLSAVVLSFWYVATQWYLAMSAGQIARNGRPRDYGKEPAFEPYPVPIAPLAPRPAQVSAAPVTSATSNSAAYTPAISVPTQTELPLGKSSGSAPAPLVVRPEPRGHNNRLTGLFRPLQTYSSQAFLPDSMNPVYAQAMRNGLFNLFGEFMGGIYIATILSEIAFFIILLLEAVFGGSTAASVDLGFPGLATPHLCVLMLVCAWMGSRAFSSEKESDSLNHLLVVPMRPEKVIGGKLLFVLHVGAAIFILALPFALFSFWQGHSPWDYSLQVVLTDLAAGFLAACWGLWSSMKAVSTRQAMMVGLTGAFAFLAGGILVAPFLACLDLLGIRTAPSVGSRLESLFPLNILSAPNLLTAYYAPSGSSGILYPNIVPALLSLTAYMALAGLLFFATAREFARLSLRD